MANRYLALQKDVFDINKVTVFGSPTITSNGVASGLQANNFISTPTFDLSVPTTIKFEYNLKTKEQSASVYLCTLNGVALTLYIAKSGYMQLIASSNYSATTIASSAYNIGKLHFEFIVDNPNSKASVILYQNGNKVGEIDIAMSLTSSQRAFRFGCDYSGNYGVALNGELDVNSIKVYQNNQLIYTPTKPTYLLERRKPKVWNKGQFTIVGNTSISKDGVASGFTTIGWNVRTPKLPVNSTNIIKNEFEYTWNGETFSGSAWVYRMTTSDGLNMVQATMGTTTGQLGFYTIYGGSAHYGLMNCSLKQGASNKFIITIEQNISVKIDWYENGIFKNTITRADLLNFDDTTYYLFGSVSGQTLPYSSFNLKFIKIYTDNTLVFDGGAETYVYDPNKFTVVGSPTITEDGVVTYITGSNYVYIPPIDYTKPFAIKKIGFTRASWGGNFYFVNGGNINKDFAGFVIGTDGTSHKLRWFLGSTGINWNIANAYQTSTTLELNTLYYVDLIYSGEDYTIILYDSYFRELERMIVNNNTPIYQSGNGIMFGSNLVGTNPYNGTIYLTNITVENDGKEVFTGAKEQFYMMFR